MVVALTSISPGSEMSAREISSLEPRLLPHHDQYPQRGPPDTVSAVTKSTLFLLYMRLWESMDRRLFSSPICCNRSIDQVSSCCMIMSIHIHTYTMNSWWGWTRLEYAWSSHCLPSSVTTPIAGLNFNILFYLLHSYIPLRCNFPKIVYLYREVTRGDWVFSISYPFYPP